MSPDEGALALGISTLEDDASWTAPYPLHAIDPDGEYVPLSRSRYSDGEITPYPSRPAYVILNMVLVRIGGAWGPVAVGTLGVAATALLVGLTTRIIDPRSAIPALWLCGVGTPLLFYGFVLQGHSLGTTAVAGVGYLVARSSQQRWRARLAPAAAVALLIGTSTLIRRETVFVAAGLAVWSLWRARQRESRSELLLGAGATIGALVGTAAERLIMNSAFGTLDAPNVPVLGRGPGLITGRVLATRESLLLPSFDDLVVLNTAALIGLVLVLVGAALLRERGQPWLLVTGLAAVSGAALLRLLISPDVIPIIPGLLLTTPALIAGLFLVPVSAAKHRASSALATTSVVIALAVLATQYGADWTWGGRFFSILLPPVAVLSALGWTHTVRRLPPNAARVATTAACGSVLALAVVALSVQYEARATVQELVETIASEADDDTIIATTLIWLPRFDTEQLDAPGYAWAWTRRAELPNLLELIDQRSEADRVLLVDERGHGVPSYVGRSDWTIADPVPLPTIRPRLEMWVLQR
ncbi:MAG: hypothetical protein ACLFRV_13665 [Acidimicrobiales bacterium]